MVKRRYLALAFGCMTAFILSSEIRSCRSRNKDVSLSEKSKITFEDAARYFSENETLRKQVLKDYFVSDESYGELFFMAENRMRDDPESVKPHMIKITRASLLSPYGGEAFSSLSVNERIAILNESLRYDASSSVRRMEDVANEFLERFSETKIYEVYLEDKEILTKDARDKLSESELVKRLNGFAEGLRGNIRRRVFRRDD
jgi:hypothetical protein